MRALMKHWFIKSVLYCSSFNWLISFLYCSSPLVLMPPKKTFELFGPFVRGNNATDTEIRLAAKSNIERVTLNPIHQVHKENLGNKAAIVPSIAVDKGKIKEIRVSADLIHSSKRESSFSR